MKELEQLIKLEGKKKEFSYRDYDALILRQSPGYLCGYIFIPEEHKLYDLDFDDIEERYSYELPTHGGLTFSGELMQRYAIGFDCAHAADLMPSLAFTCSYGEKTYDYKVYRNMEYVETTLKEMIDFIIDREGE